MKAVKPTLKNKAILGLIINLIMFIVFWFFVGDYSLKQLLVTNLIVIFFYMNWLPKTFDEMDEREKIEFLKIGSYLWNVSAVVSTIAFIIYLTWMPQMSVMQFFVGSMGITFIFVCVKSVLFKKELSA